MSSPPTIEYDDLTQQNDVEASLADVNEIDDDSVNNVGDDGMIDPSQGSIHSDDGPAVVEELDEDPAMGSITDDNDNSGDDDDDDDGNSDDDNKQGDLELGIIEHST